SVVDEHTTQLVANGFVHQCRNCSRINTAAHCRQYLLLAYLLAYVLNRSFDKTLHVPLGLGATYLLSKVLQDLCAPLCMYHLWLELDPIESLVLVANRSRI